FVLEKGAESFGLPRLQTDIRRFLQETLRRSKKTFEIGNSKSETEDSNVELSLQGLEKHISKYFEVENNKRHGNIILDLIKENISTTHKEELEKIKFNEYETIKNDFLDLAKTLAKTTINNQLSTYVIPSKTQMSGFIKNNGDVDLDQCLNEVNRRASEIGCTNFVCSIERFEALATEDGELTNSTAREAITILQGEMEGYYKNARRESYGLGIKGPDFIAEGLGELQSITHVEIKNPVGSSIKITGNQTSSISKQGKTIGKKLVYQQNFWSNINETSKLKAVNHTASFPQSPNNLLGLVDSFDVPFIEKAFMEESVLKGSKNNPNIKFINNK
ncbi:MAG: hypothetical protein ACI85O_003906, partial [Saprospiraceae bacterium]